MVEQSDIDLINKFFRKAPKYSGYNPKMDNITDYAGKHILENHRVHGYMDRKVFQKCMTALHISPFPKTFTYPIRLKKEYGELWKCC